MTQTPTATPTEPYVTIGDVAERLSTSRWGANLLIRRLNIPIMQNGRIIRVLWSDVERAMREGGKGAEG